MKWKLLFEAAGERTYVVILDTGDEVVGGLRAFAGEAHLKGARFTAIGALRSVQLGFFNLETKEYDKVPIDEQVEVLSLIGNIAQHREKPKIHAHIVVGKRDGTAHGGHLLEAQVRPTLEVMLVESPQHLQRHTNEETGLPLLDA